MVMNEFTQSELKRLAKQMKVTPSEAMGCAIHALLISDSVTKLASISRYRKNKKEFNLAVDKNVAIPTGHTSSFSFSRSIK